MKTLVTMLGLLGLAGTIGCGAARESDGSSAKDVVTQGGLLVKHYYAEGDAARRSLCPFGINSEDAAQYRSQCNVTHTISLTQFASKLEDLYRSTYKNGAPLTGEESELGGLLVQTLSQPNVLKVRLSDTPSDPQERIVSRMAGLFEAAFGAGQAPDGGGGGGGGGGNEPIGGQTIMTTSMLIPLGISQSPLLISQNAIETSAVQASVSCNGVNVIGMSIAEGGLQPVLSLTAAGGGKFKTASGNKRKMAMVQLQFNSAVQAFCTVTVKSATADGGNDDGGSDNGGGGQGEVMMQQALNIFGPGVVQPFQVLDLSPVLAKRVKAELEGCNAKVTGLQVAEGPGQTYLALQSVGNGEFKTISGNARRFYGVMVQAQAQAAGSCVLKIRKLD